MKRYLYVASCVVLSAAGGLANDSVRAEARALVADSRSKGPVDDPSDLATRSRGVTINRSELMISSSVDPGGLYLETFDAVRLQLDLEPWREPRPGTRVWIGRVADDPLSSVVISNHGDATVAIIRSPKHGQFEIAPLPVEQGGHVLREVDPKLSDVCATETDAEGARALDESAPQAAVGYPGTSSWVNPSFAGNGGAPATTQGGSCSDDGSEIDVLVVFTPTVGRLNGGPAGVEALAAAWVAEANQAYANSLITTQLNLVEVRKISYISSGYSGIDLYRLETPGDGHLDQVQPLREATQADIVTMIAQDYQGTCGQARFAVELNGVTHPEKAYNVVAVQCSSGGMTFAHEVGHNQGCRHEHGSDSSDGAYSYSHGHNLTGGYRTVMSIATSLTSIPYFSNPDVSYSGAPTGTSPYGFYPAHNALSINNVALAVSNFRCCTNRDADGYCSVPGCPPSYDCGGGSCGEQIPLDCTTSPFGSDYCKDSAGDVQLCPGGIEVDQCECQTFAPGAICLNHNQTMQCLQ